MSTNKLTIDNLLNGSSLLFNRKVASIKAAVPQGHLEVLVATSLSELSRSAYGDVIYAHILGIYNGLLEDEVPAGTKVLYPSIDAIKDLI